MARRKVSARLHLLSVREIVSAADGDHGDGGGLLLRVTGDRAAWVFRYTAPTGKRREMGLGTCHRQSAQMAGDSIRQARDKAAAARALLAEHPPRDPIDERTTARAEVAATARQAKAERLASVSTLARVARKYHETFIEPKLSTAQSARWIGALEIHVPPALWHRPIAEIGRADLLDCLLDLQGRMADTAQRVRRRLDEVYDDAIERGLVTGNPIADLRDKLRRRHVSHRVTPRPSLPFPEVPAFMGELRAHEGIAARCLEFVILTAARTGEAIGATWGEIAGDVWTVPAERMKGGEAHTVCLSPRAVEIVDAMREVGAPWVFPSPVDQRRPLSNMAMLNLLKRMGRADFVVHGFRASFSTWANETDAARPDVIEACLAHREGDRIRAAYNRAKFTADRRALLLAWGEFVAGAARADGVTDATPREAA